MSEDEHTVTRSTPDSGAEYVFTGTVSGAYLLYLYLHTPRWRCTLCRSQLARGAPPLRFVAKYCTSAPSRRLDRDGRVGHATVSTSHGAVILAVGFILTSD